MLANETRHSVPAGQGGFGFALVSTQKTNTNLH
ncbi:Uncharacterised protein [Mobiluncus mulieris]|nr:Uncharacterised protein [Mobiluncus mulieris]STY83248.1 Uncharacterised protein [Mobiluncus mulieris]